VRTYPTRSALYRIATIDTYLRHGRCPNASQLAREIEVSRRTIYRDIEYMRTILGAPIRYDESCDGYRYTHDGFQLPALDLSEGDLLALLVATQVTRAYAGTPIAAQVERACDRLSALLPEEISVRLSDLAGATSFAVSAPRIADVERVAELCDAARTRHQVRVRYRSFSSGRTSVRVIDPYHLLSIDGAWYVAAYCHTRREVRLFVPERMESLEETGKGFRVPEDFDVDAYMAGAFRVMRGGRERRVRLRFHGRAADFVAERRWHASQKLRVVDGGCELAMRVNNLDEVAAWALSFGGDCEVLSPKGLREQVARLARAALRRHGKR